MGNFAVEKTRIMPTSAADWKTSRTRSRNCRSG